MIRAAIKLAISTVVVIVLAYGFFFVPLGERTLFEHIDRIAATPEAQELGDEVGEASERLGDEVRARWTPDGAVTDADEEE